MSAVNVGILLSLCLHSRVIRKLTQERGLVSVMNVGDLLLKHITFSYTRKFTQEKNLTCALNVENPSLLDPPSPII